MFQFLKVLKCCLTCPNKKECQRKYSPYGQIEVVPSKEIQGLDFYVTCTKPIAEYE